MKIFKWTVGALLILLYAGLLTIALSTNERYYEANKGWQGDGPYYAPWLHEHIVVLDIIETGLLTTTIALPGVALTIGNKPK